MSNGEVRMGDARESKMLGLELVRFTCALSVLIWHYQHFYQAAGSPAYDRDAQPLHGLLSLFYDYGLFGVQIFWAISGFIFFWKYAEPIATGAIGGGRFFWLRLSRLYPLHFVTLLIVAGLQPIYGALTGGPLVYQHNDAMNFVLQLFMATQWFGPTPYTFNGPVWSVSAEILVYALFFMSTRRFGTPGWLIASVLAAAVLSMTFIALPTVACLGFFFAGGAAAKALSRSQRSGDIAGPRTVAAVMAATVIGGAWWTGIITAFAAIPVVLLLSVPPLLFLAAQDWPALDRWQGPIQAAGNLTYSSYLCHFPLQLVLAIGAAASGIALPVQSPLFLVTYLAVTLVIARLVFERFERPAQDWIRAMVLSRRAAFA